jgi:glycosyltransferase involved in cell wall biosynthesis
MGHVVTVCEGRAFDQMLRAALLCLALAKKMPLRVHFEKADAYSPWRHLLSPAQQRALRALEAPNTQASVSLNELIEPLEHLGSAATAAHWEAANKSLQQNLDQQWWIRPSCSASPLADPTANLVLLDAPDPAATYLRGYGQVFAFAAALGTAGAAEAIALPLPVETSIFHRHTDPLGSGLLLLGGTHPEVTLQFIDWLTAAQVPAIVVFDPVFELADYVAHSSSPLPAHVQLELACGPRDRARLYRRCNAVLCAAAPVHPDNHFLWEAVACGLTPLGCATEQTQWDAAGVLQARKVFLAAPVACSLPQPVDFAAAAHILVHPPQTSASSAPSCFDIRPHQIKQHIHGPYSDYFKESLGTRRVAVLCLGEAAVLDAALQRALPQYQEIHYDPSDCVSQYSEVVAHAAPTCQITMMDVALELRSLLEQQVPVDIDLIHVDDSEARKRAVNSILQQLLQAQAATVQRSSKPAAITLPGQLTDLQPTVTAVPGAAAAELAGPSTAALPRFLLHAQKRFASRPSAQHIGVSVATDAIAAALVSTAPARFDLSWMGKQAAASERGRYYFYPYGDRTGLDNDECDYASLPHLLQTDQLDLLCSVDPFVSSFIGARALWAHKPVPVVGMLHSIHSSLGASEAVFSLLNGATYPYDAIISPSHCGSVAYAQLLEAAAQWLAKSMAPHKAPRFAGRMEVIPYGIDASPYQGLDRASCRAGLEWPQDAIILLSLGRFARQEKACLLPLMLATAQLRQRRQPVVLVLAGGGHGDYTVQLKEMAQSLGIADHVLIHENVDSHDKVLMVGAADIFVAPSDNIQETYGLSLLEAMAAACPVVAAGWNGYREIVDAPHTGLLVPTYAAPVDDVLHQVQRLAEGIGGYGHRDLHESVVVDPQALCAALETLCNNAPLRQQMGQAGRRRVQQHFNILQQGQRLGDLLLDLHGQAKATALGSEKSSAVPFTDRVGRRFAHYPNHGILEPHRCVQIATWAKDMAWRHRVLKLLNMARAESSHMELLLQTLEQAGPTCIDSLCSLLPSHAANPSHAGLRVARALKYALIELLPEQR